jgi:hypothetical protein
LEAESEQVRLAAFAVACCAPFFRPDFKQFAAGGSRRSEGGFCTFWSARLRTILAADKGDSALG